MKFCPKCRSFYDDPSLAFCHSDGIPLVEIKQTDALWNEGTDAVKFSLKITQNQIRQQRIKTISRILITTVMLILVVTVIALNIYLYFPANEEKSLKNTTLSPAASPDLELTPIIFESPSPTKSPTPKKTISPSPTITATPKTPTPTPSIIPFVCSIAKEKAKIEKLNISIWLNKILPEKSSVLERNLKEHAVRADANLGLRGVSAQVSSDCKSATVLVKYIWTILPIGRQPFLVEDERTFSCRNDGTWQC